MNESERFAQLWNDYLEGELDTHRLAELERLLESDHELLESAADSYQLHRLLGVASQESPAHQDAFVGETLARIAVCRRGVAPAGSVARVPRSRSGSRTRRLPKQRDTSRRSTVFHPTVLEEEHRMKPVVTAACLSLSVLAIFLAVYLSRDGRDVTTTQSSDLRQLTLTIESLNERLADLEKKADAAAGQRTASVSPSARTVSKQPADDTSEPQTVSEQLVALQERLDELEDAETIARLAETGEEQLRSQAARAFLADVTDRQIAPEERAKRLWSQWKEHGRLSTALGKDAFSDSETVLPLMNLARDQSLDEATRVKLLAELATSRIEEIRAPLLELFWNDPSERMRQQAVRNLTGHAADIDAQDAILWASRKDPSELVKGTAMRRLERVMHVANEATPGSPITQLTPEDLPKREAYSTSRRGTTRRRASTDRATDRADGKK